MNYTADSLYYSAQEKRLSIRYNDLLKKKKVDNRSGDEIVKDVMERGGLRFEE